MRKRSLSQVGMKNKVTRYVKFISISVMPYLVKSMTDINEYGGAIFFSFIGRGNLHYV